MITRKEYIKIHMWLSRNYGQPKKCENKNCPKVYEQFHWALKKNKKYEYKRENFKRLCNYCHRKYDHRFQNIGKVEKTTSLLTISKNLRRKLDWVAISKEKKVSELIESLLHGRYAKLLTELEINDKKFAP